MGLHSLHRYSDWGFLLLRLVVGVIFIYHGYQKWGLWTAAPEGLTGNMLLIMRILSVAEPLGGAALILGVLTQWAALGLAIIMAGAIYMKGVVMGVGFAGNGGAGWEFDLILLAANIVLLLYGAGSLAVQKNRSVGM